MKTTLIAALFALACPAAALTNRIGASAAEFLRLGAGGRALGMGEAFTAVAEGPEASYWNPAGVAHTRSLELSYTRAELPGGLHHDFMAVAAPTTLIGGAVALSFTRLSQESLERVDATNRNLGQFSPHSEAVAFSYGREFWSDDPSGANQSYFGANWGVPNTTHPLAEEREPWAGRFALGATAKMVREDLGTRSASTFAGDIGGIFHPVDFHNLILAAAVRHLGGRLRFISESEPLPAEAAAAMAYDVRFEDWRLLPAFEADVPYAGAIYGKLGLEASRRLGSAMWACLRFGYNSRSAVDLGPMSGLTSGVGVRAGSLAFDVAFQPQASLGETLRLSVGWRF
mgnify:CR=1 FL=1